MAKVLLGDDSTNTWRNLTPLHLHHSNVMATVSFLPDMIEKIKTRGKSCLFLSEFIANFIEYQYIL